MFASIILGLIQGFTEFLPVSSSGHLVLAQHLFGFRDLDPAFNVFVQGGTVISLLVYYFPRLRSLELNRRYLVFLAIATIPAVIAGLFLDRYVEAMFSSLNGLAFGFFLTTIFILLSRFVRVQDKPLKVQSSLLIGLSQAAAILPSLSRSGATIGTSLALGISPAKAFDFSFLMSIPVITGASLLSIRHLTWNPSLTPNYLVGFVVAAVTGYFSLIILSRMMKRGKFYVFAPYTFTLVLLSLYLAR